MERGQISNEVPLRYLITWDVLASLPDKERKVESFSRKIGRYSKAVSCWEIDRQMVGRMWLAEKRYGIKWELAIFDRTPGFCEAVRYRLDEENIGVATVIGYVSPLALASTLAYRQDLMAVVDIPDRGLYYGQRGLDPRSM